MDTSWLIGSIGISLICVGFGITIKVFKKELYELQKFVVRIEDIGIHRDGIIKNLRRHIIEMEEDTNIQFEKLADDIDRIQEILGE